MADLSSYIEPKSILCFGDSLTYGYNSRTKSRYPTNKRWTGILQEKLGSGYKIIEDGLNGRTTIFDDPYLPDRNGSKCLPMILESNLPIDTVVIMLGTNDQSLYFKNTTENFFGMSTLIGIIRKSGISNIILMSPPKINKVSEYHMKMKFGEDLPNLNEQYKQLSLFFKLTFIDLSALIVLDYENYDGIHLSERDNEIVADAVYEKLIIV